MTLCRVLHSIPKGLCVTTWIVVLSNITDNTNDYEQTGTVKATDVRTVITEVAVWLQP